MNNSQRWTTVAMYATIISTLGATILPQLEQLPPGWRGLGTVVSALVAMAGGVTAAHNQSRSKKHVSVPVEVAIKKGLVERFAARGQSGSKPS